MSAAVTLDDLADKPVWVAWRNEPRAEDPDKTTKVPYSPASGGLAASNDSTTWAKRRNAEWRARRVVNGAGGGIGIILGVDCGGESALGGIDLDTCRSPEGSIEPWATEVIARFGSYTEISPSGTGAKVFFRYLVTDLPRLREMMGTPSGRQFKRSSGDDHPPGFEVYVTLRYFAVTGDVLDPELSDLRLVEFEDLQWLVKEAGPTFAGNGPGTSRDSASGPRDNSRSGAAFRLGKRIHRAGTDFDAFREAVSTDPETADWYREKGSANGERELVRIWDKADDGLPTIRLVAGERPRIVEEAIDALDGSPLYRRALTIVNVAMIPAKASDGVKIVTPAIVAVPGPQLTHELGKAAHWVKFIASRQEWVPIDVPPDIAAKIAALPNEWRFKSLAGIIATPTMRPDGSLLVEPGYDEATGWLLFDPPPMPAIPEEPARDRALAALDLLDRLLDEFPFAFDPEGQHNQRNNPSRSVALSALMTPVLRPALPPAVPLHVFRAPAGGTGKSYLADLASAIATGERCPVISRSPSFEETEKRLVGAALTGQSIISVDNCNGGLQSEFLCQMVERPLLQARALGVSDLARIANAVTVFANGNNIQIAEDLVRRTIQCSLDANMERPERRIFRRNPLARVLTNRWRYVAAVLTIARAYVVAGMPDRPPPFMSFDRWSDLVRGSLIWLGCADPCDTVAELSIADPVREIRAEVFQAIAKAMPDRAGTGHPVAEIIRMAAENPTLGDAARLVAEDDGRISPKRLGKWLAASANKIAGGYKLLRNDSDKSRVRWQLARLRE